MENKDLNVWINEHMDTMIADIIDLVNIPSVSVKTGASENPYGEACLQVLQKTLEIGQRMGFEGKNHENHCATLFWKGDIDSEIGIFSHLDVVPEGSGWEYEPYQAVIEDNCIIGRGTADNKGPAMASLYAVKYLKEAGWKPRHSIRMFFGCNEENGMEDIQYYVKNNPMPAFSFTPDAAFPVCHGEKGILEIDAEYEIRDSNLKVFCSGIASNAVPSDAYALIEGDEAVIREALMDKDVFSIENCGNDIIKITVKGIAAHAAFPENSDSAEVKLARILGETGLLDEKAQRLMKAITALFGDYYGAGIGVPYEDDISGKLTHVGGMTRTEDGVFKQNINIRYTITADREKMAGQIINTMEEYDFAIINIKDNPPTYMDKDKPIIKMLTDICNKHLDNSLVPYVMGGGTYARKLKNAIGYGPGMPGSISKFGPDRGRGHQPDEYVELDKLITALRIYVEAIKKIDELV